MKLMASVVLVLVLLLAGCSAPDLSNLSQFIPGATRPIGP
jgi:hypothetical protein